MCFMKERKSLLVEEEGREKESAILEAYVAPCLFHVGISLGFLKSYNPILKTEIEILFILYNVYKATEGEFTRKITFDQNFLSSEPYWFGGWNGPPSVTPSSK